jgi:hypothetical protein
MPAVDSQRSALAVAGGTKTRCIKAGDNTTPLHQRTAASARGGRAVQGPTATVSNSGRAWAKRTGNTACHQRQVPTEHRAARYPGARMAARISGGRRLRPVDSGAAAWRNPGQRRPVGSGAVMASGLCGGDDRWAPGQRRPKGSGRRTRRCKAQ